MDLVASFSEVCLRTSRSKNSGIDPVLQLDASATELQRTKNEMPYLDRTTSLNLYNLVHYITLHYEIFNVA